MKIRRPDGYKVNCEDCLIHFYDNDILVTERATSLDYPMIPYDEWLDLPYEEASLYFVPYTPYSSPWDDDTDTPRCMILRCWVKCPLCDTYWNVWDLTIMYPIEFEWTEETYKKPIGELIDNHYLVITAKHIKQEEYGVEQMWGAEEEV